MSVWGKGALIVKQQAKDINPQILNQPDGLILEEGVDWADLNDCFFNIPHGSTVTIGQGIQIGLGVLITTAYHPMHPNERHITRTKNIVIGRNVFIGNGAIINAGVTIGMNSVIGAGSVVTKDVLPDTFIAGNPAKPICSVYDWKDD